MAHKNNIYLQASNDLEYNIKILDNIRFAAKTIPQPLLAQKMREIYIPLYKKLEKANPNGYQDQWIQHANACL